MWGCFLWSCPKEVCTQLTLKCSPWCSWESGSIFSNKVGSPSMSQKSCDYMANPYLVKLKEVFLWHRLEAVSRLMCSTKVSRCISKVSLSEMVIQVLILVNPGLVFMKKCSRSWTKTSPKWLRRIFSIPSCDGFILWSDRRVKQSPIAPD